MGVHDARSLLVDGSTRARHEGPVRGLVVCDDRREALFLTTGERNTVSAWSLSLTNGARTHLVDDVGVSAVIAHRARRLYTLSPDRAQVTWRDLDGGARGSFAVAGVSALASCTGDGRHLGFVSDVTVSPRQAIVVRSGGAVVATLTAVLGPAFSDDDRCALVISGHGALRVVPLDGGEDYTITPETRVVGGSRLCAEGGGVRVAALSLAYELVVYDLARRAVTERTRLRRGVELLGFAGGRVVTYGRGFEDLTARDLATGVTVTLGAPGGAAAMTSDGAAIVRHRARIFEQIDTSSGAVTRWHDGHGATVTGLAWSPDGALLATTAQEGAVRVLDTTRAALRWEFEHDGGAHAVAFSPDLRRLYTQGPRALVAWDLDGGLEVSRHPQVGALAAISVSADGRFLLTHGFLAPRLFDLSEGMRHAATLSALAGATDLRFVGADGIRKVTLAPERGVASAAWYDLSGQRIEGREVRYARGGHAVVDDDATVVVVRGEEVACVDLRTGEGWTLCANSGAGYGRPLCAGAGVVVCVVRRRARGGVDEEGVAVLGLADGRARRVIGCARQVLGAALSPDGAKLAVTYADGGVEVFALGG